MSRQKERRLNPWVVAFAVLIALAVFALPQGICLKTLLTGAECCSSTPGPSRNLAEVPASDYVEPCCQAHATQAADHQDPAPAPEEEDCAWTPSEPYLLASFDHVDVIVLNQATLPWEVSIGTDTPAPTSFVHSGINQPDSPALRRGSSILRI